MEEEGKETGKDAASDEGESRKAQSAVSTGALHLMEVARFRPAASKHSQQCSASNGRACQILSCVVVLSDSES